MLTVIIGGCALVVIIACVNNGEWGAAGVALVVTLLLIAMAASDRKDTKAWLNLRDYWANGGPNGQQRRSTPQKAGRVSRQEREEAARRRQAYMERQRNREPDISELSTFVCHYCGRMVKAKSYTVYNNEGKMRAFSCPMCRRQNVTKLGR